MYVIDRFITSADVCTRRVYQYHMYNVYVKLQYVSDCIIFVLRKF